MRITVDSTRCEGHNRCVEIAPSLFESDDLGYAQVSDKGVVPAELERVVRLAIANCPERAIVEITEAGSD
jgi:ferredoxin